MKTPMTTPKWNFSIYLLAILPPLFWAGNFVLGKWAVTTIPPVQLSFFRWLIALFILSGITYKTLKDHYKTIIKNIKKIFIFIRYCWIQHLYLHSITKNNSNKWCFNQLNHAYCYFTTIYIYN